jgi:hypothetical protein
MKLLRKEEYERSTCWDLEIDRDHCFFANGVLVHNSNASVCFSEPEGHWVQSRNGIITVGNDNCGFAVFAEKNVESFRNIVNEVVEKNSLDLSKCIVSVFGEWCGKGIQKGCGIHQIKEKFFVLFDIRVTYPIDGTEDEVRTESVSCRGYEDSDNRIFNVQNFGVFGVDVDFANLEQSAKDLETVLEAVEKECPVAKALGATSENGSMIGEGVVFVGSYKGDTFRFKVKGEKHKIASSGKQKQKVEIDPVKAENIEKFVGYAVTENRLQQGITEIGKDPELLSTKDTGTFVRWVSNDVSTEEMDVLVNSNLEWKEVSKTVSTVARNWFFKYLDEIIMG